MRLSPTLVALAALVLVVPQAGADHCSRWTTTEPELTVDGSAAGGPTYYYDSDCGLLHVCPTGPLFSVWVYEESNGIPGLQRGDSMKDDTCHGQIERDTIVF